MSITSRITGFIGLGNMGRPMAANLARKGVRLVVRDTDPAIQTGFVDEFGAIDGSDPEAFRDASVIVTMLPNGAIVRKALFESGIVEFLRPGTLIVDCSSAEPLQTKALSGELKAHGIALVDAPVSGGTPKAIDGTLSIMLGTDSETLAERAEAVLSLMSARIFRTGGLGSGHAMKALNNFVLGAGFVATAEAYVLGEKFGLDPKMMIDVLNASSGRNVSTEVVFANEVVTRKFKANFTFGLFSKDVGIAAQLADELGLEAPVLAKVDKALREGKDTLGVATDYSELVKLLEAKAGIENA